MMLIIADKSSDKAVDWLVENTNKNFCFKRSDIDMKKETMEKIDEISTDLFCQCRLKGTKSKIIPKIVDIYPIKYDLETAIWRYSKDYKSEYPTNSELDIDLVCELYRKYVTEFKFPKAV